ncbi:MAG: PadR family transcriptional regulator [Nitrososphaerota archaeon]
MEMSYADAKIIRESLPKLEIQIHKGVLTILCLLLLKRKTMYGYELTREVKNTTENIIIVREGTLYPILHRLEKRGLIESIWEKSSKGPPRRIYKLTNFGDQILKEVIRKYGKIFNKMIILAQKNYGKLWKGEK